MPVSGTVRQVFLRWVSAGSSLCAGVRIAATGAVARVVGSVLRASASATASPRAAIAPGGVPLRAGAVVGVYPRHAKPVIAAVAIRAAITAAPDRTLRIGGRIAPKVIAAASPLTARRASGIGVAGVQAGASPRAAVGPGALRTAPRVAITAASDRTARTGAALKSGATLLITPGQVVGRFGGVVALRAATAITASSAVSSARITSAGDVRVTSAGDRRIRWEKV